MPVCPACNTPTPLDATACPSCGLATELFHPIREAVGLPPTDPRYVAQVREILEAIGDLPMTTTPEPAPAELANAPRFPAPPVPVERTSPPVRSSPLPELPQLPAGGGIPALRQQIAEFLELARRRGIDTSSFDERAQALAVVDEPVELERLDRDLFVHLAASLTEDLEQLLARRRELARFIPTVELDEEVEKARVILGAGDLGSAQRELHRAAMSVERLEEEWGAVGVLLTEGDLLRKVVVEYGGDPTPALARLEEGRQRARAGERVPAEESLTHAALDLWAILRPVLGADLARRRATLQRLQSSGVDTAAVLLDLKEFGAQLKARNFPAAIDLYRRACRFIDEASAVVGSEGSSDAAVKSNAKLPSA